MSAIETDQGSDHFVVEQPWRMAESESWMICVLGNFPHTRFLAHTCLQ